MKRFQSESRDRAPADSPDASGVTATNLASRRPERGLILALSAFTLLMGFLAAWDTRFTIGRDAVSYLDMGDAYFRRDWAMALNGYFNPLYAWILGFALKVVRPSPYWEYPLVHLIDFLFYTLALSCFVWLLNELLRFRDVRFPASGGTLRPPRWVWIVIGFSVFLWSSLDLVEVNQTSPDMLVAAFVYLIGALLLKIRRGSANWLTFVVLGVICGLGYLTKAVFFPLSGVILIVAALAVGNLRTAAPRIGLSVLVFALLAGPLVLALSAHKGRLTFGDTGRLNYAWYVNATPLRHWQGSRDTGRPLHPTRRLLDRPATYEFGHPLGGTYPVWYDASYWYEGLRVHFSVRRQAVALAGNLRDLATLLLRLNGSLAVGVFLLAVTAGRPRVLGKEIGAYWFLLVPCVIAIAAYALVTLDPRYVGAFIAVAALTIFCAIPLRDTPEAKRLLEGVAIALFLMVLSPIGPSSVQHHYGALVGARRSDEGSEPWRVAAEIAKLGVHPGDGVASAQYSKKNQVAWARLARVRIVAEVFYSPTMPSTFSNNFFRAAPAVQRQIIDAFRRAGAKLIISDEPPPPTAAGSEPAGGWRELDETGFYAYLLTDSRNSEPAGRGSAEGGIRS